MPLSLRDGVVVDSLGFVIKHKSIIADTAGHNGATGKRCIIVCAIILKLDRRDSGGRMGNHEAEILRQPGSRNLDNGHAVQNANNAFQLHFCAYISAVERGRLLEQGVRGGGNNKDAFSVGNLGGVQGFATGQEVLQYFAAYGLGLVVKNATKNSGIISLIGGTIGFLFWQFLSGGDFLFGILPVVFGCFVSVVVFFVVNAIEWKRGVPAAPSAYLEE